MRSGPHGVRSSALLLISFSGLLGCVFGVPVNNTTPGDSQSGYTGVLITQTLTKKTTVVAYTTIVSSSVAPASPLNVPSGVSPTEPSGISNLDAVLLFPPASSPSLSPSISPSANATPLPVLPNVSALLPVPSAPTSSATIRGDAQVMAYYPAWVSDAFPPEKIDFTRFDWIDFAFAVPNQDLSLGWDGSDDAPGLLKRLVTAAHEHGKKVKLSVGGWTGSRFFSRVVSNAVNRATFVQSLLGMYLEFGLDGIDIDWEYPGQVGHEGNLVSLQDTQNFLALLQLLRQTLPPNAMITAATMTVPFADSTGEPMTDVSEFAHVLDWVLIMNYDTWGSSPLPGPNAPFSNGCRNSTQANASMVTAIKTWTDAGFPVNKIVMGVPSYGYISRSSQTRLHARQRRSRTRSRRHIPIHEYTEFAPPRFFPQSIPGILPQHVQEKADAETWHQGAVIASSDPIVVTNEDGGTDNGQVQFRDLIQQGVLAPVFNGVLPVPADLPSLLAPTAQVDLLSLVNPLNFTPSLLVNLASQLSPRFISADLSGFERHWDLCSSTPYLSSVAAQQVVSYDDPSSLEVKAAWAKAAGLRGVNMFDIHGDTDAWDLVDAIRRGLRLDIPDT